MPEEPGPPGEIAGQRELLSRLRAVVEAKEAENAVLRAERELRRLLELRLAELERRLSMDSSDSGTPSSKERAGVKEARRAREQSERERRADRRRDGQPGHRGKGLERDPDPDKNKDAEPRSAQGKRGRFTGFNPAASDKAVKAMSETVASWHLRRHVCITWGQLAQWIGPVIRGWMAYYGRFNRSRLYPLLARVNYHVREWLRAKYRRLRPFKVLNRVWERVTAQHLNALPHWRWVTGASW